MRRSRSAATPLAIVTGGSCAFQLIVHGISGQINDPPRCAVGGQPLNCSHPKTPRENFMKAEVSANGLNVPKRMLRGMHRVEIKRTKGMVVITSQPSSIGAEPDSLLGLGSNPARQSLKTGSRQHDAWIYRGK